MAQPYVGEIRMFGGNFNPAGWAFCDGSPLAISENETLFQLIGTTYGGDGQSTFNVPDLRGRSPLHMGSGFVIGEAAGEESVTLTTQQMPNHNHVVLGSITPGIDSSPTNNVPASLPAGAKFAYGNLTPFVGISQTIIGPDGGSQAHDNRQPYLAVSFIISLFGIFPTPT